MNGRGYLAFDFGASGGRAILGFFHDGRLELREVHRFPNGPVRREGALSDGGRSGARFEGALSDGGTCGARFEGALFRPWG